MKYCTKCCKGFSDELTVCPECNGNLIEYNQAPVQPVTENNTVTEYAVKPKSKVKVWLIILIVAIVAMVASAAVIIPTFITNQSGKQELKEQLLRNWSRVEKNDYDGYYTLKLNFSDKYIKYIFQDEIYTGLYETIATYEYEVVSPNEILVKRSEYSDGSIFKVRFNEDKTMMILTPSLTDSQEKEYWYQH